MNTHTKKKELIGKIQNIEKVSVDTFKMEIHSELVSAIAGQFISILCPDVKNVTLRRPFSITDFSEEKKLTTILFKVKGDGTQYLSSLKKGDEINFIAPLGNGFCPSEEKKNSLLVGAGIGIAPMLFLKKELDKKNIKNYLISGFKTKEEVIEGSDETVVGGSVLDNIENLIKEKNIEVIYSCGPIVVLKKIAEISEKFNIECQLAMEKVMACSIGVCRGCVIKLIRDNETIQASVCKDGPVFKGSEIVWE